MNLALGDTIVAVSTPPGRGGIGILRLSGSESLALARRVFRPRGASSEPWRPRPRRVYLGEVLSSRDGRILDEACLTFFPSPHSYTREDVVELNCHGSPRLLEILLDLLSEAGARPAAPGEFTYRAYLGGRIDVTQAEAVADLIEATTTREVEVASDQLRGAVRGTVDRIREELLDLSAGAEAALEFVDDEEVFPGTDLLLRRIGEVEETLRSLGSTYRHGRRIREGYPVAILGRVNVGKSTIFNALVGSSRAIVTDEPGTTRDVLHETAEMEGVRILLTDTAGLRDPETPVERIGIQKAGEEAEAAGLILFVLDATRSVLPEEEEALESLDRHKTLLVWNKTDLREGTAGGAGSLRDRPSIRVSGLIGSGLPDLRREIVRRSGLSVRDHADSIVVTSLRHSQLFEQAAAHLSRYRREGGGSSEEFLVEDVRAALTTLGEITGEVPREGIYERIFSRFCIGK